MSRTVEWNEIIGRVVPQEGKGYTLFVTPHGSAIKMGYVILQQDVRPIPPERRAEAAGYIRDARRRLGKAFIVRSEV